MKKKRGRDTGSSAKQQSRAQVSARQKLRVSRKPDQVAEVEGDAEDRHRAYWNFDERMVGERPGVRFLRTEAIAPPAEKLGAATALGGVETGLKQVISAGERTEKGGQSGRIIEIAALRQGLGDGIGEAKTRAAEAADRLAGR